jgi:aryl-alcohol dehydrogenase-like predicted oxidoreductase
VLATKGGIQRDPDKPVNNTESHLRAELTGSLRRLGTDHIALYYVHRRDPDVPIEDLAGTMGRLIDEGKIGAYGLSEVSPATLRQAHATRTVAAVQSEYSLWTRLPELGLIQATRELGIAFVPFSPLARGVLGDTYPDTARMAPGDYRQTIPRFSATNYPLNKLAIDPFKAFARARGWTVAGTAIAWVLQRGAHLVPIPGTRSAAHLAQWANACDIRFSSEDIAEIDRILPPGFAHGDRYANDPKRTDERYC